MITFWAEADLFALLSVMFSHVFVTFPYSVSYKNCASFLRNTVTKVMNYNVFIIVYLFVCCILFGFFVGGAEDRVCFSIFNSVFFFFLFFVKTTA